MSDSQPLSLAVPPTHHRKPFHLPLESNPKQQRHGLHRKAISESGCNTLSTWSSFHGITTNRLRGSWTRPQKGSDWDGSLAFQEGFKIQWTPKKIPGKRSRWKCTGSDNNDGHQIHMDQHHTETSIPFWLWRTTRHCCELLGCCSSIISRLNAPTQTLSGSDNDDSDC